MLRSLLAAVALTLTLGIATPAYAASPSITPQERYELGLKLMKRGYYTKALEQFNRVRNYHRDDPVSLLAELAIADLYFKKGEYEMARVSYEDFARLHPRHEDLDYVVFRIGLSIDKRAPKLAGRDQVPTQQAVNTWTGFSSRFPDSEYVVEVGEHLDVGRDRLAIKELYIAKFYARRDKWWPVRRRAERVLRKYPSTRHLPLAYELRGTALHGWGLTEEALEVRELLLAEAPGSRELKRLDRVLARPAGSPPEEDIFVRPYRVTGLSGAGVGAPPQ